MYNSDHHRLTRIAFAVPHPTSPPTSSSPNAPKYTLANMANFLASIFGTELDKVNCSFYFVCLLPPTPNSLPKTKQNQPSASFIQKIGACRHGDRCSRKHVKPSYSQTILMPNLYQNPAYDPKNRMNPSQLQNHFDAFYEDIWCELCKYGELEELVVCDNNNDRMFSSHEQQNLDGPLLNPSFLFFFFGLVSTSPMLTCRNRPHRQRLRAFQVRRIRSKGLRRTQFPLVRRPPHLLRTQSRHRLPRGLL
jgi:hypothetical protein